jgi:hypothetical protein
MLPLRQLATNTQCQEAPCKQIPHSATLGVSGGLPPYCAQRLSALHHAHPAKSPHSLQKEYQFLYLGKESDKQHQKNFAVVLHKVSVVPFPEESC